VRLFLVCAPESSEAWWMRRSTQLLAIGIMLLGTQVSAAALSGITSYHDVDYGFSMAVPDNWRPILLAESEADLDVLEPGYAVGFESLRSGEADRFADYIMVEILPGAEIGTFATDGSQSRTVLIDGQAGIRDRLLLRDYDVGDVRLNLVVFQAELIRLGYTIGFFAIGEQHEVDRLEAAFEILLRTFRLPVNPYQLV
jgi:hypothetical protein